MSKKTDARRKKTPAPRDTTPDRGDTRMPGEKFAFWIALAVMALLLIAFFQPLFLGGKTFQAPDNLASRAHQTFMADAFAEDAPLLERYPLWTPYVFSGMPSYASLMAAPYTNPISLTLFYMPAHIKVVSYYLVMAVFLWLLLRRLRLGNAASLLGAISFLMATHVITLVMFGHNSKVATLVFLPLVLLATLETWRKPTLRWTALLALAIGSMLLASHLQVSYYTFLAAGLFLVVSVVASVRDGMGWGAIGARLGAWVAGFALGLAASSALLAPVREYARYSIRGGTEGGLPYEYATSWSLHPMEIGSFFIPSFMGFGGSTYWGWMPFTDFPLYMGILTLFLAVLTVALWPRERLHIYLSLLGLFALVISFGRHVPVFYDAMFNFMPYFDKFRVPVMITFLLQIAVAVLAAVGFDRILRGLPGTDLARARKVFLVTGAAVGGVLVILGVLSSSGMMEQDIARQVTARVGRQLAPDQVGPYAARLAEQVAEMARADFIRILLVFAAGMALLWGRIRARVPNSVVAVGILLLVIVDLWAVDAKPASYNDRAESKVFTPSPAVQFLQAEPGEFRVLPMAGEGLNNNAYAYFRLSTILGYHPAKLKLYQDLIDDRGPVGSSRLLSQGNFNLIDMLNTRYLVTDARTASALTQLDSQRFVPVHRGTEVVVRNNGAMPRLWFVDNARVIADEEAHLRTIADRAWNPAQTALLFTDPGALDPGTGGTAEITTYKAREIRATVNSPGRSLLMMSEVYFPAGWHVTLDGEPAEFLRADYALRAVVVPPGSHELVARFDPPTFLRSAMLTFGAYGLILVLLIASPFLDRRARPASGPAGEEAA